jgi:hypothetical protein
MLHWRIKLIIKEGCRRRVFKNRVLKKIFGRKRN